MPKQTRDGNVLSLAAYIRERTHDGVDIADLVLDTMYGFVDGKKEEWLTGNLPLRLQAANWLADRGWGRPVQNIALDDPESSGKAALKGLSLEALTAVLEEIDKRASEAQAEPETLPALVEPEEAGDDEPSNTRRRSVRPRRD